jgi:hypothetical protein
VGDTITYNSSNVTNTTNPDGTTQTQTVTQSGTPDKTTDLCSQHPDAAACQQLGTPTDGPAIAHATKSISVTPVNFSGSAQCPAPVAFTAMGKAYSFDYSPLCSKLSAVVAPLLAALSALVAAWILADSFKVS